MIKFGYGKIWITWKPINFATAKEEKSFTIMGLSVLEQVHRSNSISSESPNRIRSKILWTGLARTVDDDVCSRNIIWK